MLVRIGGEEVVMGQLVAMILVVEPSPAAAVAAHFSDLLSCLVVPFCFLHPNPIHRAAAAENLRAAAAGIVFGGVHLLV